MGGLGIKVQHFPLTLPVVLTTLTLPCERDMGAEPNDVGRPALQVRLKTIEVKVKVWILVIALLTRLEQQHFTISEVAADWHKLMIPWRIMRPSIARDGEQLDPRCSKHIYHRPNQHTRPSPRTP